MMINDCLSPENTSVNKLKWEAPYLLIAGTEETRSGTTHFTESDTGGWVMS